MAQNFLSESVPDSMKNHPWAQLLDEDFESICESTQELTTQSVFMLMLQKVAESNMKKKCMQIALIHIDFSLALNANDPTKWDTNIYNYVFFKREKNEDYVMPLHRNNHFAVLFIKKNANIIYYADSLLIFNFSDSEVENIGRTLGMRNPRIKHLNPPQIKKQTDSISCGIFAVAYCEFFCDRGLNWVAGEMNLERTRQRLYCQLLNLQSQDMTRKRRNPITKESRQNEQVFDSQSLWSNEGRSRTTRENNRHINDSNKSLCSERTWRNEQQKSSDVRNSKGDGGWLTTTRMNTRQGISANKSLCSERTWRSDQQESSDVRNSKGDGGWLTTTRMNTRQGISANKSLCSERTWKNEQQKSSDVRNSKGDGGWLTTTRMNTRQGISANKSLCSERTWRSDQQESSDVRNSKGDGGWLTTTRMNTRQGISANKSLCSERTWRNEQQKSSDVRNSKGDGGWLTTTRMNTRQGISANKSLCSERTWRSDQQESSDVRNSKGDGEWPDGIKRRGRPSKTSDTQFLRNMKVERATTGKFCRKETEQTENLPEEEKSIVHLINEVDTVMTSNSDRKDWKALQRVKGILQSTVQISSESSSTSSIVSDENYSSIHQTTNRTELSLSEERKIELVKKYKEKQSCIGELIRRFNLSPDENYARLQIRRVCRELSTQTPNRRQSYRLLAERTGKLLEYSDEVAKEDIHENDIQQIGIEQAVCFGIKHFQGSKYWIHKIKKQFNLVSRHVDARITKPIAKNGVSIEDRVKSFLADEVPRIRKSYPFDRIFNVDQTAIQYEMVRNRTLTQIGRNRVERTVQRKNATTHSYTLNPCISASGHIIGKTFVTLCEPQVPKSFSQMVAPFTDLHVTSSTSGIMSSRLAIEWISKVLIPNIPDNSILLLDSWYGFHQMMNLPIAKRKKLEFVVFPKKTTSRLQPLDLSFNRQLKNFLQKIQSHIRSKAKNIVISKRANQLEIIRFTMNQFRAPRFQGLIQRGFYEIGTATNYAPYDTPDRYCLNPKETAGKICSSCHLFSFVKCGYCDGLFCITCALKHLH